jgi:hypothetical protein
VFTPETRDRLANARTADSPVSVVSKERRGADTATQTDSTGTLTWHYRAENVRDVAWGTSDQYV